MGTNSTKYDTKGWKYVDVTVGSVTFSYAFKTNMDTNFAALFGHKPVTTGSANLIVGANYPKPARASGKKAKKYGSSFIDPSQYTAAKADGFNITASKRGAIATGKAGEDSHAVKITVAGIDYAWNMPDDTYALIGDVKATLKIEDITTSTDAIKSVVGASFPKPARWKLKMEDKTVSTFGDDDAAITPGGAILGARKFQRALNDPAVYGLAST